MISIEFLQAGDRDDWDLLVRGYKEFYETATEDSDFDLVWLRLLKQDSIFGLGAKQDGRVLGIAHYLFHTSVWAPRSCYLQDLFTLPAARGQGIATALIIQVATNALDSGANRLYWHTQEHNKIARKLYDKVADFRGFVRYEYSLER